ncbi:MAG: HAD family phosphatase [Sedimentisphaerales bacterium]|nr:HAD family phosphatase [Sedimentisphaerales bacterium]
MYGLLFDVDGVIADTEAVNARASIQMFADLFGLRGVCRADFAAGLGRGAEAYVRAAAAVHGFEMTDEQVARASRVRQDYFLAILRAEPLGPFPGVVELMNAALARPDVRVAIATSSTREKSQAVLESAAIPYRQMAYVTGSDVTRKKPHPELFLTAAQRIELPPQRCVVIEDAPDGVEAAHNAGCKCIAVTNSTTAENLSRADLIVNTLSEIDLKTIVRLTHRE